MIKLYIINTLQNKKEKKKNKRNKSTKLIANINYKIRMVRWDNLPTCLFN